MKGLSILDEIADLPVGRNFVIDINAEDAKAFELCRMQMISADSLVSSMLEHHDNNPLFEKALDKFIAVKSQYEVTVWEILAKYAGGDVAELCWTKGDVFKFNINPFVKKLAIFKCIKSCGDGNCGA